MINIFHIISSLGIGGAQSMACELYLAIDKYYHQYPQKFIYTSKAGADQAFIFSYGVECKFAKNNNWIIKKINKSENPVVIYHKLASSNYSLLESIRKHTNAKIIAINHTLYHSPGWSRFKKLDRFIAVSKHMSKKMKKWYPNLNILCIRNGVNQFRYENIKPVSVNKKKIILTGRVNRICGWKFSQNWIKFCTDVKLPVKMIHQYIGSGLNGRNSRVKIKKGARNRVEMLGSISNFKQKVSIMKSWQVMLYETNRDEGISMAILESLACGVPVLISNNYGNKEVVKPGINGYVFKNYNHAREILTDLINNPKKLKELKITTKQHFKDNLDAKYMADSYVKIIREITGEKKEVIKVNPIKEKPVIIKEKKIEIVKTKKDKNKFTIITSSYNKAKNLRDWADSIMIQNYRPLEVVISNDCSTDSTREIVKGLKPEFKKKGIEFKFVDNPERLYCGGSYYNIINYITGSYTGVLDADDMLEDGAVEYVMNLYKKNPDIYWIYSQFLWCNEKMERGRKGLNSCPPKGQSLLSLGKRGTHGIGSGWRTFSYKIERPDKLFDRKLYCAVDKNFGYRIEEQGPGLYTDKKLYIHRGHPIGSKDSVSSTKDAMEMWKRVIKKAENRRKKYKKKIYPIRKEK